MDEKMTMEITNDRLEEAIKQYAAERTKENLTTVLNLLRPTKLYVPAMLKAPDQPTPCFLKNNKGEQFFVAYTSKEQMPEEPKSQALLFMPFPACNNIVVKPELELTLMEPTGKRVDFLKYLCGELGLTGVEFAKERAEEAARKIWREQFDVASARAVAALPVLCEYCLPLVRVGGVFIAMKGPDADAELGGSAAALKKLGGAYGDTRAFPLPDGSERRLVVCKKISQTPTAYPRNGGKIAKKPL